MLVTLDMNDILIKDHVRSSINGFCEIIRAIFVTLGCAITTYRVYTDSMIYACFLCFSFCTCRLVFPTVLVIYQMMVLLLDLLIKETNLLLKDSLLCNSRDLIENLSPGQSATFCQISGNVVKMPRCTFTQQA